MTERQIKLKIISPGKVTFEGDVDSVLVPVANGPMLVIDRRAPLISSLNVGVVYFYFLGEKRTFLIETGIMEVKDNTCTILSDQVVELHKSDRIEIAALLATYKKDINNAKTTVERNLLRNHIEYSEKLLSIIDTIKKK